MKNLRLIQLTTNKLLNLTAKERAPWSKEAQFQSYLIDTLSDLYGEDIWFTKVSDRYITGVPDIVGCISGRFFALELKRDEGKPSKLQEYNIELLRRAGGEACVIRTVKEALEIILTTLRT